MADTSGDGGSAQLVAEFATTARRLAEYGSRSLKDRLRGKGAQGLLPFNDPTGAGAAFRKHAVNMAMHPRELAGSNLKILRDLTFISQNTLIRLLGNDTEPYVEPEPGDRRFKDEAWDQYPLFDAIKQSYLATSKTLLEMAEKTNGLDRKAAHRVRFYTRQFVDAMAPSNVPVTNPVVLREAIVTRGRSLLRGLNNLLDDLETGNGKVNVTMTDMTAFEVGKNLATTPGKVVFQNDLMQLIQYAPSTAEVSRRPLLIIPPWLNKYYILDLKPENSLVKYLVDRGHTVFLISWVNPDERHADKAFEDYMLEGPLAALDAIESITGEDEINAIGYCLGGILLSSMLAWMAKRDDERVKSAAFFTTMVDFSDVGDISVFIDDARLRNMEKRAREQGYLKGENVAWSFRMLRANDLIWSYFVNNYLLGKDHIPFDLLYWNADATNMPATAHPWVIRNFYIGNKLRQPDGVTLAGEKIDVTKIRTPSYVLSTHDDHIAPWRTTYETTQLFGGPVKFVLGNSGHIAGVINPPTKTKYGYRTARSNPPSSDDWLLAAKEHDGSWWPDYDRWLKRFSGGKVKARKPGGGGRKTIEDAPGSYVKVRL